MSGMQKMNMEEMEVVKGGFNSSVYKAEFSCPSSVADFKKKYNSNSTEKKKRYIKFWYDNLGM